MIGIIAHLVGMVGMALVVFAFYQNVTGKWTSEHESYNVVNLSGAVLLLLSLCVHHNLGSFIIELFWIAISVKGLKKCAEANSTTVRKILLRRFKMI